MRILLLSSSLALAIPALAQCTFDPTVTPNDLILCPNAGAVLSTQVYDSYQWYKDGTLIPGATTQTHPVQQFNDAGSSFSVSATLDGCTEMSPEVLVDGWAFLGPNLMNGGDEPNGFGENGQLLFCVGDTFTLEMMQPYTTHIVWYDNGTPIPNATGSILTVTTTGNYTASGAPDVCPDFVQQVGVDIATQFNTPVQPMIEITQDGLCASPTGNSYQWYQNGTLLEFNAPCLPIMGEGAYQVFVDYGQDCQVISEPFIIEGIGEMPRTSFTVAPNPATTGTGITWTDGLHPTGSWTLLDMSGRTVRRGAFSSVGSVWVDTKDLPAGRYLFKTVEDGSWAPVPLAVVR